MPVFRPTRVSDGLYKFKDSFYHRPKKPDNKYTWRALDARTHKAAKDELARLRGHVLDNPLSVSEAVHIYEAAGCPDKRRLPRTGRQLSQEKWRCKVLLKFWKSGQCAELTSSLLDAYADWRIKISKNGHGGRAADLEIVTLKNAIRWVVRRGLIRHDPFALLRVTSYRRANVRHCREMAPKSGNELHDLAAQLFEDKRSVVLGWLTLITAMLGCRISEMLLLRTDAKPGQPGSITGKTLWLRRSKKGVNNFAAIHPALKACLAEFFKWREQSKYKDSPWWFPGRDPKEQLDRAALSHALNRIGRRMDGARTAHGLRSFYVTCRRSEGISDAQIALETGQISGGREIVRTYGEATPTKVSWLPTKGKPAWVELYENHTVQPPVNTVPAKGKIITLTQRARAIPA